MVKSLSRWIIQSVSVCANVRKHFSIVRVAAQMRVQLGLVREKTLTAQLSGNF